MRSLSYLGFAKLPTDAGPSQCAFAPGVTAKSSSSTTVRGLLQTVTTQEMPDTASSDSPEIRGDQQLRLDQGFDRAQRVASGRVEAADVAPRKPPPRRPPPTSTRW